MHLDQIRRHGSTFGDQVVEAANGGVPFGQPRDPATVADPENARAEVGVSAFYNQTGAVVENLDDQASSEIFRDIHGRTPPQSSRKPDLLVDGEFRDVFRPNPLTTDARAARNAADSKLLGQTQRLDIWLSGADALGNQRTIAQMETGWNDFLAELGGVERFVSLYTVNGRPPVEVVVLDSVTGVRRVLFSGTDNLQ